MNRLTAQTPSVLPKDKAQLRPQMTEETLCEAAARLRREMTEEALWDAVIAFQDYPFRTVSGLPFTYKLKIGRRGGYTKELLIDRRENSKSLSWSSVALAFRAAREKQGTVVARPKELGDIRGVSYIYPMFWRLGIIDVPPKAAGKMQGDRETDACPD